MKHRGKLISALLSVALVFGAAAPAALAEQENILYNESALEEESILTDDSSIELGMSSDRTDYPENGDSSEENADPEQDLLVSELSGNGAVSNSDNDLLQDGTEESTDTGAELPFVGLENPDKPVNAAITALKEMSVGKLKMQAANKKTQVDGYQFKWALDSGFTRSVKSASSTKHYLFKSGLIGGQTYFVKVRTFKIVDEKKIYSNWSKTKSIKLDILPPKPSVSLANKSGAGFTAKWNPFSNVAGYQIRYATYSDFSDKKTVTLTGASKSSCTKKGLVKNQTYYVGVRSFNIAGDGTKYYSPWSDTRLVTLVPPTPTPKPTPTATPAPTPKPTAAPVVVSRTYVLNTNTGVFHYSTCGSVKKMSAKNRWDYTGTRSSIIGMGYRPCQNCHP